MTVKITFMGAGSTVFARNVIGDCMCSEVLRDSVFALYDIDRARLEESRTILEAMRASLESFPYPANVSATRIMPSTMPHAAIIGASLL